MAKTFNGITVATLTETQAAIINNARQHSSEDERKQIKREVFAVVKAKYGIPESMRLSANTTGAEQRGYLVLHTGGKDQPKRAFRLNDQGLYSGELVSTDQLFPPPAVDPAPGKEEPQYDGGSDRGSIFGGSQAALWSRLDPILVAQTLTQDHNEHCLDADELEDVGSEPGELPTPHLMLAGRDDLAVVADGSIWRKV